MKSKTKIFGSLQKNFLLFNTNFQKLTYVFQSLSIQLTKNIYLLNWVALVRQISMRLTIFSCLRSCRIRISLKAVMGNPSFSFSIRTFIHSEPKITNFNRKLLGENKQLFCSFLTCQTIILDQTMFFGLNKNFFRLMVHNFFDNVQIFLTVCNIFSPWSKVTFYLINLHIWAKIFDHIQKVLTTFKKYWMQSKNFGRGQNSFELYI